MLIEYESNIFFVVPLMTLVIISAMRKLRRKIPKRNEEIEGDHLFQHGVFFQNQFHFGKKIKKFVRAIVVIYFFSGSNPEFFYKTFFTIFFIILKKKFTTEIKYYFISYDL